LGKSQRNGHDGKGYHELLHGERKGEGRFWFGYRNVVHHLCRPSFLDWPAILGGALGRDAGFHLLA